MTTRVRRSPRYYVVVAAIAAGFGLDSLLREHNHGWALAWAVLAAVALGAAAWGRRPGRASP